MVCGRCLSALGALPTGISEHKGSEHPATSSDYLVKYDVRGIFLTETLKPRPPSLPQKHKKEKKSLSKPGQDLHLKSKKIGLRRTGPKSRNRHPFWAAPRCRFYDTFTSTSSPTGPNRGSCKTLGKHGLLLREKLSWGPSVLPLFVTNLQGSPPASEYLATGRGLGWVFNTFLKKIFFWKIQRKPRKE